jgi:hypothetical protein
VALQRSTCARLPISVLDYMAVLRNDIMPPVDEHGYRQVMFTVFRTACAAPTSQAPTCRTLPVQ